MIETSEAVGLRLLTPSERDPLHASTFGVGEMICDAQRRARQIIAGLGGSATNDGGFGMARALGFKFFAGEQELTNGPIHLPELTRIQPAKLDCTRSLPADIRSRSLCQSAQIIGAVDVRNPLLGERGATRVFGPQKGTAPEHLEELERGLARLAQIVVRDLRCDHRTEPGAGAAGGLGFGLISFCGAKLRPGFDVVSEAIELEDKIKSADVVITGEGRLDIQSLQGKAPVGVAKLARRLGKRVYAIVGELVDTSGDVSRCFDGIGALVQAPHTRDTTMDLTIPLLRQRASELAAILKNS